MPTTCRIVKRRLLRFLLATFTGSVGFVCATADAADFNVSSIVELETAINSINGGSDSTNTITLTGDITLSSHLPLIDLSARAVDIVGGGHTLSGGDATRILFVNSGTVNLSDVTLENGSAQGGAGGNGSGLSNTGGGGGGLGAGGAVFVNTGATLSLTNTTLAGHDAIGGNGGGSSNSGIFGSGGGGGLHGDGGNGAHGSGGGGGFIGDGGNANLFAGGGGGGQSTDGANAANSNNGGDGGGNPGSGADSGSAATAGSAGQGGGGGRESSNNPGGDGGAFGGGGGSGWGTGGQGGDGGDFAGGGGGSHGNGGDGGFGGGSGGSRNASAGTAGFGGGQGSRSNVAEGGEGLGGAIFVRTGGTLIINEGTSISGGSVTGGNNGVGANPNSAEGSGVYLHTGVIANFNVAAGQTATIADDFAGSGAIYKNGDGTLTLNGDSDNTQSGQVNGGTMIVNGSYAADLAVGSAGTLGGSGTLGNVSVAGSLTPGNSIDTQNFGSLDLQSSSTTTIEIQKSAAPVAGTHNDQIIVSGTATIQNGATLHVTAENVAENNDQNFTTGAPYTFMQADTITGTFTSVTDDLAFYNVMLNYETNAGGNDFARLSLHELQTDFTPFVSTANQNRIAVALNHAMANGGANWTTFAGLTGGMTNSQAVALLNQAGGDSFASSNSVQIQSGTLVVGTVAGQIRNSLPSGALGGPVPLSPSFASASVQPTRQDSPFALVSHVDGGGDSSRPVSMNCGVPVTQRCITPWSGWVLGYGLGGSAETDGNASGLHFGLGGMTAGISRRLDATHQLGFFGGYVGSNTTGQSSDFSIQTDSGQFGSYLTGQDTAGYYMLLGGFQFDGYDSTRNIAAGPITGTAAANYDGWQAFTYGERGWDFQTSDRTTFQPYAGLQYVHVSQDSFVETGAGVLNLAVDDVDADSLRSVLGARLITSLGDCGWRQYVVPQAHVGWMHEFLDTSTVVGAQFAGVGGSGFVNEGLDLGRDFVIAGGGVNLQLTDRLTSSVNYNTQVNEHQDLHVGSLLMTYQW